MGVKVLAENARRMHGFTLIELMIVIAIVGIISAFAYSSYQKSLTKSRRADATGTLSKYASAEENYRLGHTSYTSTPSDLNETGASPQGYYAISVSTHTPASGYTITADPVSGKSQSNDSDCHQFKLDSTGKQSATNSSGNDNTSACWGG